MRDETNFLTKEEYARFLDAIPRMKMFSTDHEDFVCVSTKFTPQDLRLLFEVIYEGALRVSEALKLTPNDLIIESRALKLEGTKGAKKSGKVKYTSDGKRVKQTNTKREFGTVKDATFDKLIELSQRIRLDERFFKVTRQTVWRWAKEIGEIANISLVHEAKDTTNVTVHTFRHSRAIHYIDAGQPINIVQKKLRHRSLQPTTTYTTVNTNKIKEVENDI